jgi:hypothetical protein
MDAAEMERNAARDELRARDSAVNEKLGTIAVQLATLVEKMEQFGEIEVKHDGLEVRVKSLEGMIAEKAGASKARYVIGTMILSLLGSGLGVAILKKIGWL